MEKLLVIEDTRTIGNHLTGELEKDYTILPGTDYAQAMDQFQKFAPKVVTLDLGPPDPKWTSEGFRCMQSMLASKPATKVVVLTGDGERETAHRAISCGAYDFYQKPVNLAELKIGIRRAFHLSGLEEENSRRRDALAVRGGERRLSERGSPERRGLEGIVGQCAAMRQILAALQKVAHSEVPVLITGESGTGKELMARTLCSLSPRATGPFVSINCGAIPEQLLESELFGVECGARFGAVSQVPGKIESARNGTLYLDELGKLPHHLQVRLLRFLEEGKLLRMGGKEELEIDTRVICAISKKSAQALHDGELRDDLYYRIAVVTLELPPLRARGEDIMQLAHFFLKRHAQAGDGKARGFTPAAVSAMESHPWPGNIQELENRVQRGVVMTDDPLLEPEALGFAGAETARELPAPAQNLCLKEARDRVEKGVLCAAVDSSGGNLAKASELLGVSRPTLYDLLKKHGLFRQGARGEASDLHGHGAVTRH